MNSTCLTVVHQFLFSTLDLFSIFHLPGLSSRVCVSKNWCLDFISFLASISKRRQVWSVKCHVDDQDFLSVNGRIQVSCGHDDCLSEWEVICSSLEEFSWLNRASLFEREEECQNQYEKSLWPHHGISQTTSSGTPAAMYCRYKKSKN